MSSTSSHHLHPISSFHSTSPSPPPTAHRPKRPDIYLREEHAYFIEAGFEAVVYGVWRRRTHLPTFPNAQPRALSTLLHALTTPPGIRLPLLWARPTRTSHSITAGKPPYSV
ncbi:hypothetical protein JB92DRAFT_3128493 [Gautieria morchelliformis]|nr:hypothetical protein JB92DRAFT_3128493 [Gautieria morchelliformis]